MIWAQSDKRRPYLIDENGEFVEPVRQFVDFMDGLERSPNTIENYCRHLERFFTFLEQLGRDWRDVVPDDLVEYILWLRNPVGEVRVKPINAKSPRGERTINTMLAAVGSFYTYQIVAHGAVVKSPVIYENIPDRFSGFKPFLVHVAEGKTARRKIRLKEPEKVVKRLAEDAFDKFVKATKNLQFQCALYLMFEGGLRTGELLGLHIQDVDFAGCGVWIRRRNGLANKALAKGMKRDEERFVDLPASVIELVDRLVMAHTYDTDHLFVVRRKDAKDRLGSSTYGRPLSRDGLKGMFRYYSQRCDIRVHAHLLRHSHAKGLIEAGWDLSEVQERLGHKSIYTTAIYTKPDPKHLKKKYKKYEKARRDRNGPTTAVEAQE